MKSSEVYSIASTDLNVDFFAKLKVSYIAESSENILNEQNHEHATIHTNVRVVVEEDPSGRWSLELKKLHPFLDDL